MELFRISWNYEKHTVDLAETKLSDKQFGKLARAGFIEVTVTLIARLVCNLVMERPDNELVSGLRKVARAINAKPRMKGKYLIRRLYILNINKRK